MNIANKIFKATHELSEAEDELYEAIEKIIGDKDYSLTWDWYDMSLEFLNAGHDINLTPEQRQQIWNLGFSRCWVCYGTKEQKRNKDPEYKEKYYER